MFRFASKVLFGEPFPVPKLSPFSLNIILTTVDVLLTQYSIQNFQQETSENHLFLGVFENYKKNIIRKIISFQKVNLIVYHRHIGIRNSIKT